LAQGPELTARQESRSRMQSSLMIEQPQVVSKRSPIRTFLLAVFAIAGVACVYEYGTPILGFAVAPSLPRVSSPGAHASMRGFSQAQRDRAATELWSLKARVPARIHHPLMMADADIEGKLKGIIAEQLGVEEDKVVPAASFTEDLGADSLDAVELIMAIEEAFDIEIPDEEAEKMTTPADCVTAIKAKM